MKLAALFVACAVLAAGQYAAPAGSSILGPGTSPPPAFVETNSVALTGTLTPTSVVGTGFGSPTLVAGFFAQPGSILRATWHFVFAANGSVSNTTILIKLASVTIATITLASPIGASSNIACTAANAIVTARTVGASGTVITNGFNLYCMNGSTGNVAVSYQNANLATSTVDTTGALLFDISVQLGNTAQSLTTTNLTLAGY